MINSFLEYPFVIPILHDQEGGLAADTIILDTRHINSLFSFNRAYFMIDCDVPSAVVGFLHSDFAEQTQIRTVQYDRPAKAGQSAVCARLQTTYAPLNRRIHPRTGDQSLVC